MKAAAKRLSSSSTHVGGAGTAITYAHEMDGKSFYFNE